MIFCRFLNIEHSFSQHLLTKMKKMVKKLPFLLTKKVRFLAIFNVFLNFSQQGLTLHRHHDPELLWNLLKHIGGPLISNGLVISYVDPEGVAKTVLFPLEDVLEITGFISKGILHLLHHYTITP